MNQRSVPKSLKNAVKSYNMAMRQMMKSGGMITNYMNSLQSIPSLYEQGGKIHIKPENRGKFTKAANHAGMGVQQYASHVLANKEDYSPLLVKRANFARNFGGSRQEGGDVMMPGDMMQGEMMSNDQGGDIEQLAMALIQGDPQAKEMFAQMDPDSQEQVLALVEQMQQPQAAPNPSNQHMMQLAQQSMMYGGEIRGKRGSKTRC